MSLREVAVRALRPDRERPFSRPLSVAEAREQHHALGVAVFILDSEGKTWVVEEQTSNTSTGKVAGEFGIPCETVEPGEEWEDAVLRCLSEEVRIPTERVAELFKIDPLSGFLGEEKAHGVYGRGYQVRWVGTAEEFSAYAADGSDSGETRAAGWFSRTDLRNLHLREATRVALRMRTPEIKPISRPRMLLPLTAKNLRRASSRVR